MFGVLAGVAFVACTNDNEPAGSTPVKGTDEVAATTKSYMNISLAMPGNAATRAAAEGFEYGETKENTVTSGVLLFFDGTTQVADPFDLKDLAWTNDQEPTIEKISEVVVVLENPLKNPTSVVALLNADLKVVTGLGENATDDAVKDALKSMTLNDLKKVVADFSATDAGKFVMSSSAYNEAVNKIAAEISEDMIWDTEADAKKAPSVKIPVERVVAKVLTNTADATLNLANAETPSNTVVIGGQEVTLTAKVMGWWLDNTASTSLLLKDITGMAAADNDKANMRSYWAKPVPGTLNHGSWSVADPDAMALPQYVQENVAVDEAAATDAQKANNLDATQVVVAVQLLNGTTPVQLVKYLGKLYYQEGFNTEAINVLAHKYYTKNGNDFTTVGANDFTITYVNNKTENASTLLPEGVTLKDYQAYTLIEKADAQATFYVKNAAGEYVEADATVLANDMKGYVVQQWNDGMAYYFTAIKHDASRKAVIRNHVYKVNVNSINGLGTPVPFEDTDTIIPIIPENEETYISAEIDILAWKVVENNVNLTAN